MDSIARLLIARRRQWTLVAIVLILALGTGVTRNAFDSSFGALLTRSDPYLEELEELSAAFPTDLEISFVFVPGDGGSVFVQDLFAAIEDLAANYQSIPSARRVSTLLNYYSPETQQRLFTRDYRQYTDAELQALQRQAVQDRLLTANLLATDASLTFGIVRVDDDGLSNAQRLDVAEAALRLRTQLRGDHPGITIHVNSEAILEQTGQQAMVDDLTNLLPIIILICVAVMGFCFRSVLLAACILSHQLVTLICTLGLLGYLGFAFNSISIIAPLVVVIIAVANSVHIISIYRQALARAMPPEAAMEDSLRFNLKPVTLAALTTAIGFSSLNMCSSPAIQDFGRIVAIGIFFAYVLTLLLLPSLLILLTPDRPAAREGRSVLQTQLLRLDAFTLRQDRPLFWFFSAVAVVTLALLPLNETDFNRLDFISADSDIDAYYDTVSTHMNRGPALTYGIDTGRLDGAIEPAFLRRVEAFLDWLQDDSAVESAASVLDVVKTANQFSRQNDPDFYSLPDDIDTVASHLNNYFVVQSEDFPLSSFIDDDFSTITLFVNAVPLSNQELLDMDARLTAEFAERFDDAELLHGSGLLLFSRMDELVTIELLQGYTLSLILITLSLVIGLRSVYFGVLSVLPNLLPATIVFGVWALFVGQLDPFVMMLFSISIGLVVDDTVHILSHYLDDRQRGSDQDTAIRHAIETAGPALTITTLILALGTTLLIGANTIYFQQAAKLLVPIVVLALLLDLTYLPGILRRFDRRPG